MLSFNHPEGGSKLFFGYATGTNLMFHFRVGASVGLFPERSTPDALLDAIEHYRFLDPGAPGES